MDIGELIKDPKKEVFLEKSGWLSADDPEATEAAHHRLGQAYEGWRPRFEEMLGAPVATNESNPAFCSATYPEAMKLACWEVDQRLLVLAYGQHDLETPVFVSFGPRDRP